MEQANAQTEKIATYETSRTRRSIVDGSLHSDDSNNDEEYASSGFYVREKTSDKKSDSSDNGTKADVSSKENGIESEDNGSASPLVNGENSKDGGDNSRDAKQTTEEEKENETEPDSGNKEAIESQKPDETTEHEVDEIIQSSTENIEDNSVSSSSNNQTLENVCSSANNDEETDVSSTSNNVNEPKAAESDKVEDSREETPKPENVELDNEATEPEKVDDTELVESEADGNADAPKKTEVDEPKETETESKDEAENAKSKEVGPEIVESAEAEKIDESKEVEIIDEPKEVITIDECETVDSKEVTAKTAETKQAENADKPKTVESGDVEIIDDEPKVNEKKSKEDIIEIDDKNDKEECAQQKDAETKSGVEARTSVEEKSSAGVSILKEQLERTPSGNDAGSEQDMDMDEDFDPSLLCPDISMDVDEAPVMTNSEAPDDGSTSPLPYEPIFSTLVDEITGAEVQIDLTPAEMELRQKMYGPNNPVQTTKVHCTACNVHLGSALTGANNRFVHPLLKVLICKNCYHFYTSGEFEKDEDGSELYCRWCGQGGQVLCCSSCEFVFCKRCIKNNFGQRKFKEIRDSDDWNCFRCEPEQLSSLRASCAEFMEYYRTELARAQALSTTNPELMTTDYTKCCCAPPEKKEEPKPAAAQKTRRKRKEEDDPDYEPQQPEEEPPPMKKLATAPMPISVASPNSVRPIVPKPVPNPVAMRQVATSSLRPPQTTSNQVFKVGNTTFRSRPPGYTVQRPPLSQGPRNSSPGYITIPPSSAPKTTTATTTPGYIKILPQRLPSPSRPPGSYTVVSGTSNGKPTFSTVRPPKPPASMPPMKHEWFEKTVRAAARVNSNLSYTLTQLNRQQSQATSVEALAMVHNKLQEVLSTSINSLIQIRKNLRTEFIAGIKNIKFPPKPAPPPPSSGPIVVKDDDDVIFVNPTSTASQSQPPPLVLSPSVTLTKKVPPSKTLDPFTNPTPSTSGLKPNNVSSKPVVSTTTTSSSGPLKGGFLKVRSLTALQSVPSECITIPDDPPKRRSPAVTIIEEEDPLKLPENDPLKSTENVSESKPEKSVSPRRKQPQDKEISSTSSSTPKFNPLLVYNVNERPTPEIKKMMDAVVVLKKSPDIDELLVSRGLLVNGASDSVKRQKVALKKEVDPL